MKNIGAKFNNKVWYSPQDLHERVTLNEGKEEFQKWAFGAVHDDYSKQEMCDLWNARHSKMFYARNDQSFGDLQSKMYGIFRSITGMK